MANWLEKLNPFRVKQETRSATSQDSWIWNPTLSGVVVTDETALTFSSVWACIQLLSNSVAGFKFNVLASEGRSRVANNSHPVYRLLSRSPNRFDNAYNFRQRMMFHVLTHGNAYTEIVFDNDGYPCELLPHNPWMVEPRRRPDGSVYYKVKERDIDASHMLHIAHMTDDLVGFSPIRVFREVIGVGLSMEKFQSSFYGNRCQPGGLIKTTKHQNAVAQENLRKSVEKLHQGPYNSSRLMLLEEGVDFVPTLIPPQDAQFLASRQFQVVEVCRIFNITPTKLQDFEHATYSNITENNEDFYITSLLPWLIKIEAEFNSKLFTFVEQRSLSVEHDLNSILLRGNLTDRGDWYAKMFNIGVLSENELRAAENLNPVEGGDYHYRPLNMTTVEPVEVEPDEPEEQPFDIGAVLQVVGSVTDGSIPLGSARGILAASFPHLSPSTLASILDPLLGFLPVETSPAPGTTEGKTSPAQAALEPTETEPQAETVADTREALAAVLAVVEDTADRMTRREVNALRRVLKKPDAGEVLDGLDGFYRDQATVLADAYAPGLAAYGAVSGQAIDVEDFANRLVKESRDAINEALGGDLSVANVEELVSRWEVSRASDIVSKVGRYTNG